MWVFDCTVMFPITVGIALPLLMYLFGEAPAKIITAICAGAVLDVMHIGNMKKGPRRGRDHARPGLFQGETAQRTLKSFRPKK